MTKFETAILKRLDIFLKLFSNYLVIKTIESKVVKTLTDKEIENIAVNENSMLTLTQYGVELVKENLTTLSEVTRVCKSD